MISCIIIDDDKNITGVFNDILSLIGLQVVGIGHDGSDAIELYKKHKPDVMFVDVNMPKYDGFYAVEKTREFDPDAKIIMVTADFTQETQQRLEELCVTALIYKPFDPKQIQNVLLEEYKINLS
ncbi:MAG: response regulator [Nitrosopumilus sp.]|nr:response regulator [Nitrosopumilus sp.]